MQHSRTAEWVVVAGIVLALVVAGAVPGAGEHGGPSLDDGTASVSDVSIQTDDLRIDRGRFGTGVFYLRVPDATLHVDEYAGTPRLVYRVQVPDLDADVTITELVTRTGPVTLSGDHEGIGTDDVTATTYDATVEVRVQSFAVDETVFHRNQTVGVRA